MEERKSRLVKLIAVLIVSALLTTAMVSRGVTANNEAVNLKAAGSPARLAQAADFRTDHTVSVKRLQAATKAGNALLILQFNDKSMTGRRLKIDIDNRPTVFCDDGTSGDEVAGDGKLSAVVNLDFAALTASQRRIQTITAKAGTEPTIPVFDGRVLIGQQAVALRVVCARISEPVVWVGL